MHWKLFESMYEAFAKRKAIEQCLAVKNAMLAGVWGNTNFDPQKEGEPGARPEMLEEIEAGYLRAVTEIRLGPVEAEKAKKKDDIDWTDPFFAAIKAPRIDTDSVIAEAAAEPEKEPSWKAALAELDQS